MFDDLLHPARVAAAVETIVAIAVIVAGIRIALRLAVALLRRALRADGRQPPARQAQLRTLVPMLESVLRYVFYFTGLVMVLDRLHFNVAALLASAGIVGVAIGFGAQYLIRDVIAGFFLLFEGLIQVGDVVRVGDVIGEVERLSLRTTQIRQYSGELVTIPNGEIQRLGNRNRGFMRALVVIPLSYEADVTRAMTVMLRAAQAWAAEHPDIVLAPPEVQGVVELGATDVRVRAVVMVRADAVALAERDLGHRLLEALGAEGVALAAAHAVVIRPRAPGTG